MWNGHKFGDVAECFVGLLQCLTPRKWTLRSLWLQRVRRPWLPVVWLLLLTCWARKSSLFIMWVYNNNNNNNNNGEFYNMSSRMSTKLCTVVTCNYVTICDSKSRGKGVEVATKDDIKKIINLLFYDVCLHVYLTHTCVHTHTHVDTHTRMYTDTHTHMYTSHTHTIIIIIVVRHKATTTSVVITDQTPMRTHTHTHTHTHMHIHTHTCVHTHRPHNNKTISCTWWTTTSKGK